MRRAYGSPRTFPALRWWSVHSDWRKRTWQPQQKRHFSPSGLGEWAFLRYTGTAWEARGRRRQLLENQQTRELFGWSTAQALGDAAHSLGVGAWPDVENHGAGDSNQRQTPLGSHGRCGKRLRDRHAVLFGLLLLGAALDDLDVRELTRDPAQEHALATVCLEQRHLPVRQGRRERDSRSAAARADVDDPACESF